MEAHVVLKPVALAVRHREALARAVGQLACALRIQLAFRSNQSDGCHHRNGGKEKEAMATFTIDSENNITGYAPGEAIPDGDAERFTTESELAQLAAQWPAARQVEGRENPAYTDRFCS